MTEKTPDDSLNEAVGEEYEALKHIAARQLLKLPPGQTLGATALVHEAYLKVAKKSIDDRVEAEKILMMLSFAIRDVLVQHVRSKLSRMKRDEAHASARPDEATAAGMRDDDLLALDEAIRKLEATDPDLSRVVIMYTFGELPFEKIAEILGVSLSTVKRRWRDAKAWIAAELEKGER